MPEGPQHHKQAPADQHAAEPRVTVDGVAGQLDATRVPRSRTRATSARPS